MASFPYSGRSTRITTVVFVTGSENDKMGDEICFSQTFFYEIRSNDSQPDSLSVFFTVLKKRGIASIHDRGSLV